MTSSPALFLGLCGVFTCAASFTESPSRTRFFKKEAVVLKCEDSSAGWTVRRNTSRQTRTACGREWGKKSEVLCSITFPLPWDSGVYWCESKGGGASSILVNISVSGKPRTLVVYSGSSHCPIKALDYCGPAHNCSPALRSDHCSPDSCEHRLRPPEVRRLRESSAGSADGPAPPLHSLRLSADQRRFWLQQNRRGRTALPVRGGVVMTTDPPPSGVLRIKHEERLQTRERRLIRTPELLRRVAFKDSVEIWTSGQSRDAAPFRSGKHLY